MAGTTGAIGSGGDPCTDRESRTIGLQRTEVFGVPYFRGTLDQATELVVRAARGKQGGYACLCNVHVLETALRDQQLMLALTRAMIVFPDGAPIAWAQRFVAGRPSERIGGPDLMDRVFQAGAAVGLRHAVYGSTENVLARLQSRLKRRHAEALVVSAIAPPFGARCERDVEDEIEILRAARPDIVWVALGAPRQELWASRHAAALAPALLIGVGAAVDFLAGTKPRAPHWMQAAGLEWLHRLSSEPRRLGIRYLTTNSRFVLRVGKGIVRMSLRRERTWR